MENDEEIARGMAARLEPLVKASGRSEREIGNLLVGKPDLIRDIRRGRMPGADRALLLARYFEKRVEWLVSGEGPEEDAADFGIENCAPIPLPPPPASLDDGIFELSNTEFVSVPRYDAALSAGHGAIVDPYAEPLGHAVFERQWLAAVTRAMPQYLAVLQVDGDSMESTLSDRDWVLVDRTQTRLNRSGIYALQVGDAAWIKRIELDLERKLVQIISDNPKYGVQRLDEGEICVLGRVVWVVGRRI